MPEDATKITPFPSPSPSGLIEAHLKVFSVQLTSLEKTVNNAFQRLEKIVEDHEKRHRDAEKARHELAKELSTANTRIVQLEAERKTDAERARADVAEVKADIARLEAIVRMCRQHLLKNNDLADQVLAQCDDVLVRAAEAGRTIERVNELLSRANEITF